jgi:hypothetical protein
LSFSRNFGNYYTSPDGKIYGGENIEAEYGIFQETKQFSGFIEANKGLQKRITIGIMSAFDIGSLYENGFGLMGLIRIGF